jgi:hypothetical protein
MVSELYNPAWIALENEDHSAPDLGGRHCHCRYSRTGVKKRSNALSNHQQRPDRYVA